MQYNLMLAINQVVTWCMYGDLVDIWTEIARDQKHNLWCDGLREPENKKRSKSDSDDEDEDFGRKKRKVEDKEENVSQTLRKSMKTSLQAFSCYME